MKSKKAWSGILILILIAVAFYYLRQNKPGFKRNTEIAGFVGKNFNSLDIIDSSLNPVSPDFSSGEFTIIDFWFGECPGCLIDMKEFDRILNLKKGKVKIISISINSFKHWKALFHSDKTLYSFMNVINPDWKHYVLNSKEDPHLKNDIPSDNINFIIENYKTHSFPVYFVIDQKGKIIETPMNAVDYLESEL